MSIYASFMGVDDWQCKPTCKRMKRTGRQTFEVTRSQPCTCGAMPIIYQGSHILPSVKDARGGSVGIAAIPGHITRKGKPLSDDNWPWYPFLRIEVYGDGDDKNTVVLTKKQVKSLRDELTSWLEHAEEPTNGK